jgi:cardiolipin synthase A/B
MAWRKNIGIYPWHQNQHLHFLKSGKPFFEELLGLIQNAKESITIQVYIFAFDKTGEIIKSAIVEAAKRGVKINIILDAFGSASFPKEWIKELKVNKVELAFFSKLKFAFKIPLGMRLHHKIFIFDEQTALLGGINISNNYSHWGPQTTWLDFGILVQGNTVLDLLHICLKTQNTWQLLSKKEKKKLKYLPEIGEIKSRVLQNHWLKAKFGISKQYRQKIRLAKDEILILASYFVPSPALKRLLKKAAKRGVNVRLVLGGMSDVGIAKNASTYFYLDLLKSGVQILEWQPSVMHAKIAFVDDSWMTIGSYNLNYLSDFGSIECNLEINHTTYQKTCKHEVNELLITHAKSIDKNEFEKSGNFLTNIRNFLAYQLFHLGLKFLFFLQRQSDKKQ